MRIHELLGQLISPALSTSYLFLGVGLDELVRLLYPSHFIHSVVSVWQPWRRAMMAAQVDGERDLRGCHEGDVQLLIDRTELDVTFCFGLSFALCLLR
jgi:hypothetical protein